MLKTLTIRRLADDEIDMHAGFGSSRGWLFLLQFLAS